MPSTPRLLATGERCRPTSASRSLAAIRHAIVTANIFSVFVLISVLCHTAMDTQHKNVDSDVYIYITAKTFGIWLDENLGFNTIQYIISA